jgi:peptidyl-prolyl cis-trans isomerase D
MLTKIREKTQSIFAFFLLILLVIPFALWGTYSYFEGVSREAVAEVNGTEIGLETYRRALEQFRDPRNPTLLKNAAFKRLVVERLVDEVLLAQAAQDNGYRIGDEALARLIRGLPYFQHDGQFDRERYRQILERQGLSVRAFEERLRAEKMTAQVMAGLIESGFVTEDDLDHLVRLLGQQREAAYLIVPAARFEARVQVSADEIERYYRDQAERFRTPEAVRVEYLRLSVADLAARQQLSEDELRRAYEQEADRYGTPERRRVAHILIALPEAAAPAEVESARARIEELARRVRAGEDFASLARQYSEDPDSAKRGGDLGEIRRGLLPPALETAVYALKPGEVSAPVRTAYGFHLVKLTDYKPARRKPFEAVRRELEDRVRRRKAEAEFYDLVERIRNIAYEQPDSLEPVAQAAGARIERSDWFTREGLRTGIAASPKVVEAAFQPEFLEMRRNSDVIELDQDTVVVLRLSNHRPAALKPLEAVRAEIEHRLRQEKAVAAARELGQTLLERLSRGEDLAVLAQQHGLRAQPPQRLRRDARTPDRRLVEAIFSAPRPAADGSLAYGGVDLGEQGYALYALARVIEIDPAKAEPELRNRARALLRERRGAEYYVYYRERLRRLANVEIYDSRL